MKTITEPSREIPVRGEADVIVVGGGLAGVSAALAAARCGKKVILMSEALIYVAKDYGLEVAGQFDREPGTALYGDDLAACLEALKAFDSRVVLIEKQAPAALIRALEAAGYRVARIDNLSTHREDEGFGGYIEAQLNNARAVRRAFDGEDGA